MKYGDFFTDDHCPLKNTYRYLLLIWTCVSVGYIKPPLDGIVLLFTGPVGM